jgi:two-component system NarL family sensor kinase
VTRRAAPGVPALLGVVALLCIATTAAIELHLTREGATFGPALDANGLLGLVGLAMVACAVVVLRFPAHIGLGWVLAAVGLFWLLDGLAQSYVRLGVVTDEPLPAMTFAAWFLYRFTALLPLSIVILPLLFPDGRFVPGPARIASWAAVTTMTASALSYMVVPSDDEALRLDYPPGVDRDPTTIAALAPVAGPLVGTLQVASIVAGLAVPLWSVVLRYRRSAGVDRDRMRWLLWGVLVAALLVVTALLVRVDVIGDAALFVAVVLVPVAMTVAVVNPAVVPIQDLLGRTVVYGGLWLVLVVVDLAAVAGLTALLGDSLDTGQVVLVVLLLTVLLYGPLRQWLSGWVRRRVLGDRDDPYDVVAGLASTLETADDGSAQLAAVARAVATAFGISYVSVDVDRGSGERLVATYGDRPDETRTLPITYRDVEVGRLVLPARGLRSRLSGRDERLLGDLVRQAATAARTSRLAEELQDSRERLVVAREEERRRIRRDLHDGLGPAMSGVVFQLESARLLVDADPGAAKSQLVETRGHVQEVVADVRRLVHDLRPPALDDLGLVGALGQQAARMSTATRVEAEDLGALPAAVEVAAYRIASEATTNVERHARATTCTVRLRRDGDALLVEVSDDGVGIDATAEAGVGLVALRERAAELGGRSEVTCPESGGTVVRAWLPMKAGA